MRASMVAAVVAAIVGFSSHTLAQAAIRRSTEIPPQPIAEALRTLMKEREFQIVYSSELLANRQTQGATGELTMDEALTQLLSGTGLTYRYLDEQTITIVPLDPESRSHVVHGGNVPKMQPTAAWAAQATALSSPAPSLANGTDAAGEGASGDAVLQEIVVTAQKRPEELSRVASSVSAVTGSDLLSGGVTNALSLSTLVPTVRIDQANGLQITIRGVSSADGTEKGDPSAAFMLNGVYLARQQSLSGAFFDIDRVEVLRGPQGTLYGRNATAGVINVISKHPTDVFEASVNTEAGDYGTWRTDGMVNIPISDKFSIRAAGAYNRHDSYLVAGPSATEPLGFDQDEYDARLSADLKFGADDRGNLLVIGDYAHQGGAGVQPVVIGNFFTNPTSTQPVYSNPSSAVARTINYPIAYAPYQDNKIYGITSDLTYDFGPLNLTYLGAYRVFGENDLGTYVNANSNRYAPDWTTGINRSDSQEIRLATSGDGPLKAVLGLYYFREDFDKPYTILNNYAGFALYAFLQNSVVADSKAAFGQATYSVTDRFRITGGVRHSADQKSREGLTVLNKTSPVIDPNTYTIASVNNASGSYSKVTWKTGIEYDITKPLLLYANVSTGYKAGGFNDGCAVGTPDCTNPVVNSQLYYKPEELTAYELGLKGRLLGGALSFSVAGFYYDYTDLQVTSPGLSGQTTLNAAKARVTGIETSGSYALSSSDRFDLSANYLNAHYTDYHPLVSVDFNDRPLDNAPNYVVTAGYTHSFRVPNGGDIAAHIDTMLSDFYVNTNFANGAQFRYPSYTKTNATLTYNEPNGKWFLQAFAKNLENTITFTGYGVGRVYASEPRLFGGRAGIRF